MSTETLRFLWGRPSTTKKAPSDRLRVTETVQGRLAEFGRVAPAADSEYAYRRHEGFSLWWCGLAMVALGKLYRLPSLRVCPLRAILEFSAPPCRRQQKKRSPARTNAVLSRLRLQKAAQVSGYYQACTRALLPFVRASRILRHVQCLVNKKIASTQKKFCITPPMPFGKPDQFKTMRFRVRHVRQSQWLEELGRLTGGRSGYVCI
jgi:hypothetical protein